MSAPDCNPHKDLLERVLRDSVFDLWAMIDRILTLPRLPHDRFCVCIFGSARLLEDSPIYRDVQWLAQELTYLGCDIVTGGGPGLMEAANAGSVSADPENRTRSVGLRIALPHEQGTNPYVEELHEHSNFFSRLHHFVLEADAFVVMPGGIGTLLELVTIWQLLQVAKLPPTPLILVGSMWRDFLIWAHTAMAKGQPALASEADLEIPIAVEHIAEVLPLLRQAQARWQQSCPIMTTETL
ncbi:LOG family protein [Synechococcus elongatus]|uniref:LOG family protein n=1 Tax=Synechococcus elongatus PCC 11802 TaxID=2283154 RepID=A0AAT9K1V2_SYNEL|nr:LOG family protein [Synechococcus elongatus]QFZ91641.1 LOG family protein [Synechococcus elongatus PCC 11802]